MRRLNFNEHINGLNKNKIKNFSKRRAKKAHVREFTTILFDCSIILSKFLYDDNLDQLYINQTFKDNDDNDISYIQACMLYGEDSMLLDKVYYYVDYICNIHHCKIEFVSADFAKNKNTFQLTFTVQQKYCIDVENDRLRLRDCAKDLYQKLQLIKIDGVFYDQYISTQKYHDNNIFKYFLKYGSFIIYK